MIGNIHIKKKANRFIEVSLSYGLKTTIRESLEIFRLETDQKKKLVELKKVALNM